MEIVILLVVKFNISGLIDEVANECYKVFVEELSFISVFASRNFNISFKELFSSGNSLIAPVPPTIFEFYYNLKYQRQVYNDQKLAIGRQGG